MQQQQYTIELIPNAPVTPSKILKQDDILHYLFNFMALPDIWRMSLVSRFLRKKVSEILFFWYRVNNPDDPYDPKNLSRLAKKFFREITFIYGKKPSIAEGILSGHYTLEEVGNLVPFIDDFLTEKQFQSCLMGDFFQKERDYLDN